MNQVESSGQDTEPNAPNPNSGIIARSLYKHPIARFLAESVTTAVGVMVAGKVASGQGVRLGKYLSEAEEGLVLSKSHKTTLLKNFRRIQSTLDEWEGISRTLSEDGAHTIAVKNESGFFINAEDRARAAAAKARGEYAEDIKQWAWRDELQKRLIHRARALPVELPAIYLTSKAVGHFTQQPKDEDRRVHWYNPADVISDFAKFTVQNVGTQFLPWEVGTSGASTGWRKLMTYGDEVSDSPAFNQHIKNFSVGLQSTLSAMGQSTSNILYQTTKRASRTAGAFSTAIKNSTDNRTAGGFLYRTRISNAYEAFQSGSGVREALEALSPDTHRFYRTFKNRWDEIGAQQRNFELLASGRGGDPRLLPEGTTDLEQLAQSVHRLRDGGFANIRARDVYRGRLLDHLSGLSTDEEYARSVREFVNHTRITMPSARRVEQARFDRSAIARDRVSFGLNRIYHVPEAGDKWEDEMVRRLQAIMPQAHAEKIVRNLPNAVQHADIPFLTAGTRREMYEGFQNEFEDFYHRALIPAFRDRARMARLPSEMVSENMSPQRREMFVRRLANSFGLETKGVNTFTLNQQLAARGINTADFHDLRGQLLDRGIITKPWQRNGFNIFGLRPLTMDEAIKHRLISSRRGDLPAQIARDIGDPYLGGQSDIIAGRGLYKTVGGKVVDLRKAMNSLATFNDLMARHLRVPILGFSPYDLFGYEARRKMRMSPLIQVQSGKFGKFFPGEATGSDLQVYIGGQRRGYGRLYGYSYGKDVQVSRDVVRPGATRGNSILTRGIRRGLGESGHYKPPPDTSTVRGKIRNWLDIAPDQPESLWNKAMRIANSRAANKLRRRFGQEVEDDLENPANFANFIHNYNGEKLTAEQLKGLDKFRSHLERNYTISPSVADKMREAAESGHLNLNGRSLDYLKKLFTVIDPVTGQERSLSQIQDAHVMYRSVEAMLEKDRQAMENMIVAGRVTENARLELRSPQEFLKKSFLEQENVSGAMDEMSPRAMSATQIHRRLDEFRAAVYSYAIQANSLLGEDSNEIIDDLLASLDQMKAKKLLRTPEYIEAKAAVLGVQVRLSTARSYRARMTDAARGKDVLTDIMGRGKSSRVAEALREVGNYGTRFRNGGSRWYKRPIFNWLGAATEKEGHDTYNIYSPHQDYVYVPTTGSVLRRNPKGGVASLLGLNNWSDPNSFSMGSIVSGHLSDRLNRYFSMVNLGINPNNYRGSASYFAVGMVGKRVLPAVVGLTAFNTIDRTAGGVVYGKDDQGRRRYRPLVGGAVATGLAHAEVAVTPGRERRQRKREELFGSRLVPVRRGRYWLMGSSSFWGGRVMYWRPSWYKRYLSGYKYGDEGWKSPIQQALYGYDFSPLRPINPYKYEERTYETRPYPYSGNYFSGPWGPLTPMLNATIGHALKPHKMMHKQELYDQLNAGLQRVGNNGMVFNPPGRGTNPLVATRNPTGSIGLYYATTAGHVLGAHSDGSAGSGESGDYYAAYRQPYSFRGVPHGTHPEDALASYRSGLQYGRAYGSGGGRAEAAASNAYYLSAAGRPIDRSQTFVGSGPGLNPYNRMILARPDNFDPRVMYAANPINPGKVRYQGGEAGYTAQEMAGIYGFGLGAFREAFTSGSHDFHPDEPVFQSADRAYGSERSFWDLNLGGLGDFPLRGLSSEFDSIEASEIIRRFVPHRRREINEVNPIPNRMGAQYPWLPGGADYFMDFTRGDPYSSIMEGELRLPGSGYEKTHQLHPDFTGKYGILDQLSILGDVAPWSPQYKALNQAVAKMKPMMPEDYQQYLVQLHDRVAAEKKRHTFAPYKYAHTNFKSANVQVTGFIPGEADLLVTSGGIIQLAGIRAKKNKDAEQWLHDHVTIGDHATITYDANYPPKPDAPLDAIVQIGGENLNKALAEQDAIAYPSKKSTPLDNYMRMGSISFHAHAAVEALAHRNNVISNKFFQRRTAIEDWERSNVYGSSFPRWENPIQSYIKPLGYRAMNRSPIAAMASMGFVGRMFGKRRESKKLGTVLGATAGLMFSTFSNAQTFQTGQRWLPQQYEAAGAIDEYTDILNYMRNAKAYSDARAEAIQREHTDPEKIAQEISSSDYKKLQYTNIGPATAAALSYRNKMRSTLYGADPFGDVMQLSQAIPRQQRDHFLEFLNAPANERQRILSVMPRLERRIFEARWGMKVEQRPDLVDYFSKHELPDQNWEGWDPRTDMEDIKIKIIQNQGLNASQLGYYPQQLSEANALNYSYPDYKKTQSTQATVAQLNKFFSSQGINSSVQVLRSNRPGTRVDMQMGVTS